MSEDIRQLVATASRILAHQGHNDLIWGHPSARDPHGRGIWLKASGWGLDEITTERVHLVDEKGNVLSGDGVSHVEYPIHTQIMAARPDVGGVVHVHSPYSIGLAAAGQDLLPISHAANYFAPFGVSRFTETSDLIVTHELGDAVAKQLGPARAIFLVNHGLVTVGSDVREATVAAIMLEMACQQQQITSGFQGWPTWTNEAEQRIKRDRIYTPQAVNAVWDYLARGLQRSQLP